MTAAILSPGETLTCVMSGAITSVAPHYSAEWQDLANPLSNHVVGALAGTSPVTIVPDPAINIARNRVVRCITVSNRDSGDIVITISKVTAAGTFQLAKVTLQAGDILFFDDRGLLVCNSSGQAEGVAIAG